MFSFLKNLLGRKEEPSSSAGVIDLETPPVQPDEEAEPPTADFTEASPPAEATEPTGQCVQLELAPVLNQLPGALAGQLLRRPASSITIALPLDDLVRQLARGKVTVPFGRIRQCAPAGVFKPHAESDSVPVPIPLPLIFAKLRPSELPRTTPRAVVDIPSEVPPLFGPRGEPLLQAASAPEQPAARPTPPPTPALPPTPAPSPKAEVKAPQPPPKEHPPVKLAEDQGRADAPVPIKAPAPIRSAIALPVLEKDSRTASPAVVRSTQPSSPEDALEVPLSSVMSGWPEAVRKGWPQEGIQGARLVIPLSQLEPALRQGRANFPWQQLRAWLIPPVTGASADIDEKTILPLPLSVIAPLFLAKRRPQTQKKVVVEENIPALFAGKPAADGAVSTATKPAPPTALGGAAKSASPATKTETVKIPEPVPTVRPSIPKPVLTYAEIFNKPAKKDWTPGEVVESTVRFNGVAGALITTADGLLVAGSLPAPLKLETLAAFTPQMFGRLAQYAKELDLAEPRHLSLGLDNLPLHIFKAGALFFTVLGRPGETLPRIQLNAIAVQLERQAPPA